MDLLPSETGKQFCNKAEQAHIIHLFAANKKVFEKEMAVLKPVWENKRSIGIWVSWYKKSSGKQTDLTEDIIRRYALSNGAGGY